MVVVFVVIEETRTFARGGGKVRRTVVFVWYFVLLLCVNVCVCISSLLVFKQSEYIQFSSSVSESSATCNTPSSYRQPSGNGQVLSRRYCTPLVCLVFIHLHLGVLLVAVLRTRRKRLV